MRFRQEGAKKAKVPVKLLYSYLMLIKTVLLRDKHRRTGIFFLLYCREM